MKKTETSLISNRVNPSPDYYCTWQTQLYATSDGKPAGQRAIIGERALFEREKPYGWAYFYEQIRNDLYLVMDDSWDVPLDGDLGYCGSLVLDAEKFPAATAGGVSNTEALARLCNRMKALGWKGLGGWVCAQEAERLSEGGSTEDYWRKRLREANDAGFSYWKVDWGKKSTDPAFRRMLTDLGRELAPGLTIEHACIKEIIPYADVYRTYDVPAILSIPMTMRKLADCLAGTNAAPGYAGLVDCEDEPYMAAAGGFCMGIMRHPYSGPLPNGHRDMSFPDLHRNIKTKMYEVIRAVHWHRIAPAFGADAAGLLVDTAILQDDWRFESVEDELEAWWLGNGSLFDRMSEQGMAASAPARIARGTSLPQVVADEQGNQPYVLASRHPNGAAAVATLGRTYGRVYEIPLCEVTLDVGDATQIGVFGEYRSLVIESTHTAVARVLMQDLADATAYDVTEEVTISGNRLTIPGELIHRVGTMVQPAEDTSEPGVVIQLIVE